MAENTGIVSFFNDIIQQNLVSHFDKPDQSLTFVAGRVKQDTPNISANSDIQRQTLAGAVVGKVVDLNESYYQVVKRNNWTSGAIYNAYDPTKLNQNHYVLVTEPNGSKTVYLCMENGDAYSTGRSSVNRPDGSIGSISPSEDGYKWMALYNITGNMVRFLTAKHMPVPTLSQIDDAPSSSSLKLSTSALNYWYGNRGSLYRFDIADWIRDLRWDEKPSLSLRERTNDEAQIELVTEFDSDNVIAERRGWSIKDVVIKKGGSGYTTIFDSLFINIEPKDNIYNATLDNIIGNEYNSILDAYGPGIRPLFTLGALDFPTLLGSDKAMLVLNMDSSSIEQITGNKNYNTFSLVRNLKTEKDGQLVDIKNAVKPGESFRMTTILQIRSSTSTSNFLSVAVIGGDIHSFGSGTNSTNNTVVAVNTAARTMELSSSSAINGEHFIQNGVQVYNKGGNTPSTIATAITASTKADKNSSSSTTAAIANFIGTGTNNVQTSPTKAITLPIHRVSATPDRYGTNVVYTQKFDTNIVLDNNGQNTLQLSLLVGGSEITAI